jgi:hypothetical protein
VAEYIASFHARNGLAPNRMGDSASKFDAALAAILARHCPAGLVRLQVGARLIWGTPLAPEEQQRSVRRALAM